MVSCKLFYDKIFTSTHCQKWKLQIDQIHVYKYHICKISQDVPMAYKQIKAKTIVMSLNNGEILLKSNWCNEML